MSLSLPDAPSKNSFSNLISYFCAIGANLETIDKTNPTKAMTPIVLSRYPVSDYKDLRLSPIESTLWMVIQRSFYLHLACIS